MGKHESTKPEGHPKPPQPPPQESVLRMLLGQILQSWWGKIVAILAGFLTLYGCYDLVVSAFRNTTPEIHSSGPDATPFVLPFLVKNNSGIFDMNEVVWTCYIDHIITKHGGRIVNLVVRTSEPSPTISAGGGTASFRCPIGHELVDGDVIDQAAIVSAVMIPILRYKTFWFSRSFSSKKFEWFGNATPPRWIESDLPS